jgi:hypothetical protein
MPEDNSKALQEIIDNPKFWDLSLEQRHQYMTYRFPGFKNLTGADRLKVIGKKPEPKTPDKGFFSTLLDDVLNIGPAIFEAGTHPVEAAKGMYEAQKETFEGGMPLWKLRQRVKALGYWGGGLTPLIGPATVQTGEEINRGQYGQAGAHLFELLGPEVAKTLPAPTVFRGVRNVLNPVEEQALESVEGKVPMSVGQRTGQRGLQRYEQKGLLSYPGSASRAEKFYRGQEEALSAEGRRLAGAAPGVTTDVYGAGQAVQTRLGQRIVRLKGQADRLYDEVRAETEANVRQVQVGTETSPILGPTGAPITTPVMRTFETPVDLASIRGQLRPIYDDLMRSMPEARRANSPAFRALEDVMKSPAQAMNAMDFDKFLGSVKALTREGKSEFLSTQSQGLAKQIIKAGDLRNRKPPESTMSNC